MGALVSEKAAKENLEELKKAFEINLSMFREDKIKTFYEDLYGTAAKYRTHARGSRTGHGRLAKFYTEVQCWLSPGRRYGNGESYRCNLETYKTCRMKKQNRIIMP